ncbi:hypothetical protein F52700_10804 [Fusarium sp. NRRL 52700]|nr:hypothetical protein F52700_10804 [Fusarium sp. NRRL 52700]
MALKSFHRMMDLPPEIRFEIYFLATPDRVVHTRCQYSTRDLYCSSPIPSLLHTCSDSRTSLERTGYKLAFQDPSSGRRIWFNFERDTLFIDRAILALMAQGINPFPFGDTQRTRRIAYERKAIKFYKKGFRLALQIFGELQEIFLIQWQRRMLKFYTPWLLVSRGFPDPIPNRHSYDTRNLCKFAEIQKIDTSLPCFEYLNGIQRGYSWLPGCWCTRLSICPPAHIPEDTDLAKYLGEPYEKWRSLDHEREDL